MAFVSTIDRKDGVVSICTAPGCEKDVDAILEGLAGEMPIEPVVCHRPSFI